MAIPEIPDYQAIMLPLLEFAKDKKEHSLRDAVEHISNFYELTEEQRKTNLSSGNNRIKNRVGWAEIYLKKARLLESTRRSFFKITERGLDVLKQNPKEINNKYLEQFREFVEWINTKKQDVEAKSSLRTSADKQKTPEDSIDENYQKIKNILADDLLNKIKECSPEFFEKLVVDLLLKIGYGGSQKEAGEAIGRSGDEGIDGIIKEDKLGLDTIYIQAKRWNGTVGRPEIHKFVGALQGQGAKKGVFITTSNFSKEAEEYADMIGTTKIVLINGEKLTNLMIENDIGVSKVATYEIKKLDLDYFEE